MNAHSAIHRGNNHFREALQHRAVVLTKGIGLRGKNFEQTDHPIAEA